MLWYVLDSAVILVFICFLFYVSLGCVHIMVRSNITAVVQSIFNFVYILEPLRAPRAALVQLELPTAYRAALGWAKSRLEAIYSN